MTALLERERTGRGRLVEVAMVEAVFASLATAIDQYHRAGRRSPREPATRSRTSIGTYNVYAAKDGYVAIILVTEAQCRICCARWGGTI